MVALLVNLARFELFTGRTDKKILFGVIDKFLRLENVLTTPFAPMAFIQRLEVRCNVAVAAGQEVIDGAVFAVGHGRFYRSAGVGLVAFDQRCQSVGLIDLTGRDLSCRDDLGLFIHGAVDFIASLERPAP